jgi:hypothetical protein
VEARIKDLKNVANRFSSQSASKRVPYHEVLWVLPMAEWLKRLVFTQRARVQSRAQKSVFILLSKVIKIFAYPYFYVGNTMVLLFSVKTFNIKSEKFFREYAPFKGVCFDNFFYLVKTKFRLLGVEPSPFEMNFIPTCS